MSPATLTQDSLNPWKVNFSCYYQNSATSIYFFSDGIKTKPNAKVDLLHLPKTSTEYWKSGTSREVGCHHIYWLGLQVWICLSTCKTKNICIQLIVVTELIVITVAYHISTVMIREQTFNILGGARILFQMSYLYMYFFFLSWLYLFFMALPHNYFQTTESCIFQ